MPGEKNLYKTLPIPSYEEATEASSSRTRSDELHHSERQGLLGNDSQPRIPIPTRRVGYRPPTVEDAIDEDDLDTFLGQDNRGRSGEDEEVRREMEELEIEDDTGSRTAQSAWGKRISNLSQRLSIPLNFPLRWKWKPRLPEGFHWPRLNADLCIVLARCFAILLVIAVFYVLFMSDIFSNSVQRTQMFQAEEVRAFVQGMVDENQIRENLIRITTADHIAGTEGDYVLAQYIRGFMTRNFLEDVRVEEYGVYLNYPKEGGRKVQILNENGSVAWSAKIDEDPIYTDPPRQQTAVFHGHSKSGDVTGPLIYANYGSREDFKRLYDSGIDTRGAIALVKYYGSQGDRALKIKAAELAGFAGCIIYSDPKDDGFLNGDVAPKGRFMPEGGVQRGGVSLVSLAVGDVLTPGWASLPGAKRLPKETNPGLVNIPSIPLSWGDAKHLLAAIQGFGEICPDEWKGGVPNIECWSGNSSSPKIRLLNDQDEVEQQPIWNVLGTIKGIEQKEKSIIVGNHRDAWHYGAADPGSGTAVMMEVIRIFGDLARRGWRPLRTIEFASWDGEEYNLIGSTEWVEDHMEKLRKDAYVYLNVDVAVSGSEFRASGSPMFLKSLMQVLKRTSDPIKNKTMMELWEQRRGELGGLGADSDYVAFQDMAGTSSLDMGFSGEHYPYHSIFDNFEWMDTVGDPGFVYHKILAQIWALLILEYSDKLVLPFDISAYSMSLTKYAIDLEKWVGGKGANQDGNTPWSIEPLRQAVMQFAIDAHAFEKWEEEWNRIVYAGGGYESAILAAHRKSHNNRMANFETHLLDLEEGGGIPNRTQFKHVIFGPSLWSGSGSDNAFFPAIRDAVDAGDWLLARQQLEKAARLIQRASAKLRGNS